MPEGMDVTFYRSPAAAIAAPPETLAYVASFDPSGTVHDAMSGRARTGSVRLGGIVRRTPHPADPELRLAGAP